MRKKKKNRKGRERVSEREGLAVRKKENRKGREKKERKVKERE